MVEKSARDAAAFGPITLREHEVRVPDEVLEGRRPSPSAHLLLPGRPALRALRRLLLLRHHRA